MNKYRCMICGFEYDPSLGLTELNVAPGTAFSELPDDFECPLCGASKGEFEEEKGSLKTYEVILEEVISRTPTVKSFRFTLPGGMRFIAGQYLVMTLHSDPALSRCLSLSNSPTEYGYLEVTKRITGSAFSQILETAKPGLKAEIEGPFGAFTLGREDKKICFISGGIGITPFRSMCRFAIDSKASPDMYLIYSNRNRDEIVFDADFEKMCERCSSLKVTRTLTREDMSWSGRRGRICAGLIRELLPDYEERKFYVCGPPAMVSSHLAMLRTDLHIREAQIRSEKFEGY